VRPSLGYPLPMFALVTMLALADIAPSPNRPDWNDPPAPLPPPPNFIVATALTLAAVGGAWAAGRTRATT
jgi:hypothetical protein